MKTLVRRGTRKPYTNSSGSTISSGEVVGPYGTSNQFGVAIADIADTEEGTLETGGEHELPKAAVAWSDADDLYWDATNKNLTNTSNTGANQKIGTAVGAAVAGDSYGHVQLNGRPAVGSDPD